MRLIKLWYIKSNGTNHSYRSFQITSNKQTTLVLDFNFSKSCSKNWGFCNLFTGRYYSEKGKVY